MWSSDDIRQTFLNYFASQDHVILESSSLVPADDPTLLFTNAGMNQFKDIFLGLDQRNYKRAVTAQKCVRAGGKHNDLDTVGRTPRHHTFFEMLGNFSFGDYFKTDAIRFAWEFLTRVIELPPDRLWITIYQDDEEAARLWTEIAGVPTERIIRLGEKDNFWSMGDTGPCGPCSEILYDRGEKYACCAHNCAIGSCDCDRWLEIWNLVFMQYNRDESGTMTPLPRPSIDTGMGLERLASIMQKVESNFATDLFIPLIRTIEKITGREYDPGEKGFPFRVIADHSRACTFLIADGILPGNEGRGYVLRRILRRAVRFGQSLGLEEPFLYRCAESVCLQMAAAYPYLKDKLEFVQEVIKQEEQRFFVTLNDGLRKVEELLQQYEQKGEKVIPGEDAFMLYDTYGFPPDLTEDIAAEHGFAVDTASFSRHMEEQRSRARNANKSKSAGYADNVLPEMLEGLPPTEFTGYGRWTEESEVIALFSGGDDKDSAKDEMVTVLTASTPFYAESGGQVSDNGIIEGVCGQIEVQNVRKIGPWFLHHGFLAGTLKPGETVRLSIDKNQRLAASRNHSATHLLHHALRHVLGEHAQQKGSMVDADRLRFDFSHLKAVSSEEIKAIEHMVNDNIWNMTEVSTENTTLEQAKANGAVALFGEKYGETVRMVKMGDYSIELCGGTHVSNTGQIGLFKIISENSIGSGLRRIEAITGDNAFRYLGEMEREVKKAAAFLRTSPLDLNRKLEELNRTLKEKEREIEALNSAVINTASQDLQTKVRKIGAAQVLIAKVDGQDAANLRQNAEKWKDKLGSAVVLLASVQENKVMYICFVSSDLVEKGLHAGKIVETAAKASGGGGGGRADMAQAGGKDKSKVEEALELARMMAEKSLQ